jgi:hypothetical protein
MTLRSLLAGFAILAAGGCGGGGGGAPAPEPAPQATPAEAAARPPDDAGAIEALLRERARALERRDGAALASTATGAQRERDRRAERRTARLPLARVRAIPDELEITGDRAQVAMTLSFRLRGMSRPYRSARRVTARRTPAGWRVARDVARHEPLPWEVAAFESTRTPRFVLLTAAGVDAARLSAGLMEAYREVRDALPERELPRGVLVIGARDAAQAERLTGRVARGVVALANVSVQYGPAPALAVERVLAERMIVIDSRWSRLPEPEQLSTLVHELTHTALNTATSGRTPPWLAEAVALHISGDDRAADARLRATAADGGAKLRGLCAQRSILELDGREQGAAYAASSGAAEAIVERHGASGLFRLYDAFNDPAIDGPTCAKTTDRALRRTLGMSLAELEASVAGR